MKKQKIIQIFAIIVELIIAIGVILYFLNYSQKMNTVYDLFERIILSFTAYEIIKYIFITFQRSADTDSYLALKTCYELLELYVDTKDPAVLKKLNKLIQHNLQDKTMNSQAVQDEYKIIESFIKAQNKTQITLRKIIISNNYENSLLKWNDTIFLRLLK